MTARPTHPIEHRDDDAFRVPDDLRAIQERLDRAARAERAGAGSIEDRIFIRTRGLLARAPGVTPGAERSPMSIARERARRRATAEAPSFAAGWRIAAAMGLAALGVIGALRLARPGVRVEPPVAAAGQASDLTGAQLEAVDARLAADAAWDAGLGAELAALDQALASLESSAPDSGGFWESGAIEDLGGTEGSL